MASTPAESGGPMDLIKSYLSGQELLDVPPREERFDAEVRTLPVDWVARVCSLLNWMLDHASELPFDIQRVAIETFAPGSVKQDLLQKREERGDFFLYADQLLGLVRAAVFQGTDDVPDLISEKQLSAFFWALFRYGDLHARELGDVTDDNSAARFELRGRGLGQGVPPGNIQARAHALWLDLPTRPELAASPYAMDLAGEFAHATGCSLIEYLTVVWIFVTHARDIGAQVRDGAIPLPRAMPMWPMDAASRLASSGRADRLRTCLDMLAGDRDEMRARFEQMPAEPKFLGVAMLPFRDRPIYRMRTGHYLVLSESLLLDGPYDLAYWRIADHLRLEHGGVPAFLEFTQFYASVFERYIVELLRSAFEQGTNCVFGDTEAIAPQGGAPDAAVFLDDRVLLFEVTKTQMRYFETILAGDLDSLDADLARTAAKAAQLANAEQAFRGGRVRYAGHDSAADRALPVERVVVLSQPVPGMVFVRQRFMRALEALGVPPDAVVISVGELEEILTDDDPTRLSTMLAAWRASDLSDVTLHDYLVLTQQIAPSERRPEFLRQNAAALRARVIAEMAFIPEEPKKADG